MTISAQTAKPSGVEASKALWISRRSAAITEVNVTTLTIMMTNNMGANNASD